MRIWRGRARIQAGYMQVFLSGGASEYRQDIFRYMIIIRRARIQKKFRFSMLIRRGGIQAGYMQV